jgi:hypothetical protein
MAKSGDWWRNLKRFYRMWALTTGIGLLAIVPILVFTLTNPNYLSRAWNQRHRDAFVAYDYSCHAVHVAVSPWRFHLDVDTYSRPLCVRSHDVDWCIGNRTLSFTIKYIYSDRIVMIVEVLLMQRLRRFDNKDPMELEQSPSLFSQ